MQTAAPNFEAKRRDTKPVIEQANPPVHRDLFWASREAGQLAEDIVPETSTMCTIMRANEISNVTTAPIIESHIDKMPFPVEFQKAMGMDTIAF